MIVYIIYIDKCQWIILSTYVGYIHIFLYFCMMKIEIYNNLYMYICKLIPVYICNFVDMTNLLNVRRHWVHSGKKQPPKSGGL